MSAFLLLIARLLPASVFITAGIGKLLDLNAFQGAVAGYRLLPRLAPFISRTLPPTEIAVGTLLASGVALRPTAWLVIALLTVFSTAITVNLARGRSIDCGCGRGGRPITTRHLLENSILVGLSILVALAPASPLWTQTGLAALLTFGAAVVIYSLATYRRRAVFATHTGGSR